MVIGLFDSQSIPLRQSFSKVRNLQNGLKLCDIAQMENGLLQEAMTIMFISMILFDIRKKAEIGSIAARCQDLTGAKTQQRLKPMVESMIFCSGTSIKTGKYLQTHLEHGGLKTKNGVLTQLTLVGTCRGSLEVIQTLPTSIDQTVAQQMVYLPQGMTGAKLSYMEIQMVKVQNHRGLEDIQSM